MGHSISEDTNSPDHHSGPSFPARVYQFSNVFREPQPPARRRISGPTNFGRIHPFLKSLPELQAAPIFAARSRNCLFSKKAFYLASSKLKSGFVLSPESGSVLSNVNSEK